MKRILIPLAICAGPLAASAGPIRLSMQWVRSDNTHLAGNRGAINHRDDVKLELELQDGHRLKATDTGTSAHHNLYSTYSKTETWAWTNTWSGTWAMRGSSLRLDLVLGTRTCTRTKRYSDAAPQTLACEPIAKQVQLACTTEQISVDEGTGAAPKVVQHAAWRCAPAAAADLAPTPSIWVLGKASCLQTLGGRGGPSFRRCKP